MHRHYHESSNCFEYPKKSLLKSSHPKKYLPNFPTPKNPRIKNLKPKKILRSSPSLEIRSTPSGWSTMQHTAYSTHYRDKNDTKNTHLCYTCSRRSIVCSQLCKPSPNRLIRISCDIFITGMCRCRNRYVGSNNSVGFDVFLIEI